MLLLALLSSASNAGFPISPSDYAQCGEPDQPELCPSDLSEEWSYLSYVPEHARDSVREAELDMGSGNRVDRAWRTTTGQWEVIIAVGDSGISWEHTDLINKVHLNTAELPLPQDAAGEEASSYDLNGDGVTNVADYADDPRVDITAGRDVADDVLDPSDLIYTFSDDVDDDGNGYVDDIAGWDFFGRDNDPYNEYNDGYGTHGTGVMREAAAEPENGGDIGVCPNCAVLPLRHGDTFITDGGRVAEAVTYAADAGAVVIVLATGALSSGEGTEAAVQYAWSKDMLVAGVTGDENAYHHNYPAVIDHALYSHSVTHNTGDDDNAVYSYMNTLNCNNYGARVSFVAASSACATGSAAVTGGVVGMIHSAALEAGLTLSAGEVTQLLTQTATDVNLTDAEREESKAYPSEEGWDPFYGYGRLDTAGAVEAVADGRIPPVADISSPRWFSTYEPTHTQSVAIEGTVSADRAGGYDWILEMGLGNDPRTWSELASGSGEAAFTGTLATIDLSSLPEVEIEEATQDEGIIGRLERVNQPAVTVRLQVTDDAGLTAESRKTFFSHRDDDLLPGFPMELGGSGEASPQLADLDGDGDFEIIVATGSGTVLAVDDDGTLLPGWPVYSDVLDDLAEDAPGFSSGAVPPLREAFLATPAVGDLDGDGTMEIVAAGIAGGLYVWNTDGTLVDGFPTYAIGRTAEEFDTLHTYDQGFAGAPTLYDLDGDGTLEIIAAAMDSRLYAFSADGSDWGPYPVEICEPSLCGISGSRIITSPTIGDVDGDGDPDIGLGSNEAPQDGRYSVAYLLDARTAESLDGWPHLESGLVNEAVLLPMIGEGHPSSLAFADIDGDGDLEIANPVMLGTSSPLHHTGETALDLAYYESEFPSSGNTDIPSIIQLVANPSFGDLTGDGTPELLLSGVSSVYLASLASRTQIDYQQGVLAWDGTDGAVLDGWPRQIEDVQFLVAPAVADVSGDGSPEVIMGSGGYLVHAWDGEGDEAPGWPKLTGHWTLASPAVGDIDGDGYVEVVVTTREGWLFAWSTAGRADQTVQWSGVHHDPQNTGNYEHALAAQAGPPDAEAQGCCAGRSGEAAAWLVLPVGLLGLRRRRRAAGA